MTLTDSCRTPSPCIHTLPRPRSDLDRRILRHIPPHPLPTLSYPYPPHGLPLLYRRPSSGGIRPRSQYGVRSCHLGPLDYTTIRLDTLFTTSDIWPDPIESERVGDRGCQCRGGGDYSFTGGVLDCRSTSYTLSQKVGFDHEPDTGRYHQINHQV